MVPHRDRDWPAKAAGAAPGGNATGGCHRRHGGSVAGSLVAQRHRLVGTPRQRAGAPRLPDAVSHLRPLAVAQAVARQPGQQATTEGTPYTTGIAGTNRA